MGKVIAAPGGVDAGLVGGDAGARPPGGSGAADGPLSDFSEMVAQEGAGTSTQAKGASLMAAISAGIDMTGRPADPAPAGLTVDGNTIDTGRYSIAASVDAKKGADVVVTDKRTGGASTLEVYGDPHLLTSDGDKAGFQKNGLVVDLPDGTQVRFKPTAVNDKGVSTLAEADVVKGDQSARITGFASAASLATTLGSAAGAGPRDAAATTLAAGADKVSDLRFTTASGGLGATLDSKTSELPLDGKGGADPAAPPPQAPAARGGPNIVDPGRMSALLAARIGQGGNSRAPV